MPERDFLFLQLRDLPYFRAFLRAVESSYYQDLPLPAPVYDVGCGDGHFASLTFDQKIDVGLDPWHGPIHEAKKFGAYKSLVEADGAKSPFPSEYFASAFSNSVLEHIPHIDAVLKETARVLKPGAVFLFCVPNDRFNDNLSIAAALEKLGLHSLARSYCTFFTKIARHRHLDGPEAWTSRLQQAGFVIERWWHYFPPKALAILEWGHYFGLPSLVMRKLTGRWILIPRYWNLLPVYRFLQPYASAVPAEDGVCTFYVARRTGG
jgi:SAM-dependent methyltransferase